MTSKKDEILKMLERGSSLEEILEKGYNKKYTKEVIRMHKKNLAKNESNQELGVRQEDIVKEIKEIRLMIEELQKNKGIINSKIPDAYDKLTQIKDLIECILTQKTYIDDMSIEFKISIGNKDVGTKDLEAYKINPIELYRKAGESTLRSVLDRIPIDGLKEIAKQYTPDARGYVYKWIDSKKIIDYIVERAIALSQKGNVFISHNNE